METSLPGYKLMFVMATWYDRRMMFEVYVPETRPAVSPQANAPSPLTAVSESDLRGVAA